MGLGYSDHINRNDINRNDIQPRRLLFKHLKPVTLSLY